MRGLNPERLRFGFDASVFDGKYITGETSGPGVPDFGVEGLGFWGLRALRG